MISYLTLAWFQPDPEITVQWVGPDEDLEEANPVTELPALAAVIGPRLNLTVSATQPVSPVLNDLWVDIS